MQLLSETPYFKQMNRMMRTHREAIIRVKRVRIKQLLDQLNSTRRRVRSQPHDLLSPAPRPPVYPHNARVLIVGQRDSHTNPGVTCPEIVVESVQNVQEPLSSHGSHNVGHIWALRDQLWGVIRS